MVNKPASLVTTKERELQVSRKYSPLLWVHLAANTTVQFLGVFFLVFLCAIILLLCLDNSCATWPTLLVKKKKRRLTAKEVANEITNDLMTRMIYMIWDTVMRRKLVRVCLDLCVMLLRWSAFRTTVMMKKVLFLLEGGVSDSSDSSV